MIGDAFFFHGIFVNPTKTKITAQDFLDSGFGIVVWENSKNAYTCFNHVFARYIGETKRQLRVRIGEHRGSITRKVNNSVGRHFHKGHGKKPEAYLRVVGIEKVRPEKNDLLRLLFD